jgi:hypothetical protein
MAQLPGIDRFQGELRNAFRHRGPDAFLLGELITPVWDLATEHPEFDDAIVYWNTTNKILAALAANFSTIYVRCSQGRAIVDGISLVGPVAAQSIVLNLVSGLGASGPVAAFQDNAYQSRVSGASTIAFPLSLGVIDINSEQTVGGRLAGTGFNVTMQAATATLLSWKNGTCPPWLLSPNVSLVLEGNLVNQAIQVGGVWGRWWPEIDPA